MIKWSTIETRYTSTIGKINNGYCDIDYDWLLSSILADFHMIDIPRKMAVDEASFIEFAYNYFPIDSEAFVWAQRVVGLKYLAKEKNEYIACYKRDDVHKKILYMPRNEVEFNPLYIQHVAMAIPFINIKDQCSLFMFVKESSSDMRGHTTMIGGHVQYESSSRDKSFNSLLIETAMREAIEELGISAVERNGFRYESHCPGYRMLNESPDGGIDYPVTSKDWSSISTYHNGKSLLFAMSASILKDVVLEEGKELVLYHPKISMEANAIQGLPIPVTNKLDNPDPWLERFIKSLVVY